MDNLSKTILFKIFDFMSQYDLLNILLTNHLLYNSLNDYINTSNFLKIDSNNLLVFAARNNLIISIKRIPHIQLPYNPRDFFLTIFGTKLCIPQNRFFKAFYFMYLNIILELKYHILNNYHIDIGNDACLLIRKYCYNYLPINLKNELFEFISTNKFKILPYSYFRKYTSVHSEYYQTQIRNLYSNPRNLCFNTRNKLFIQYGFNPSGFFKHYN